MLNRQENEVMRAVYELCGGRESCLVSPYDILSVLPAKRRYTADKVDSILHSLELDDYFELLESDRKGEKVYVVTLRPNGLAYRRGSVQMRRTIAFRVALSVGGAVLTFLVGLILRSVFS